MGADAPESIKGHAAQPLRAEAVRRDCEVQSPRRSCTRSGLGRYQAPRGDEERRFSFVGSGGAKPRGGEEGRRRKQCAEELEKLKRILGDGSAYERSGVVLEGCKEVMK